MVHISPLALLILLLLMSHALWHIVIVFSLYLVANDNSLVSAFVTSLFWTVSFHRLRGVSRSRRLPRRISHLSRLTVLNHLKQLSPLYPLLLRTRTLLQHEPLIERCNGQIYLLDLRLNFRGAKRHRRHQKVHFGTSPIACLLLVNELCCDNSTPPLHVFSCSLLEMAQMSQSSSNSWGGATSCSTTPIASFSPPPADGLADSPEGFERKRRKRV